MIDYAAIIKQTISTRDFVERIGLSINRSGFICCPFHGENTPSLKIYRDGRGWYCFGCNCGGDVITFAERWYDLPFQATIKQLDVEFNLGLFHNASEARSDRAKIAATAAANKVLSLKEKRVRMALEREYSHAYDKWLDADRKMLENEPDRYSDEEWSEDFVQAIEMRNKALSELDAAAEKLIHAK